MRWGGWTEQRMQEIPDGPGPCCLSLRCFHLFCETSHLRPAPWEDRVAGASTGVPDWPPAGRLLGGPFSLSFLGLHQPEGRPGPSRHPAGVAGHVCEPVVGCSASAPPLAEHPRSAGHNLGQCLPPRPLPCKILLCPRPLFTKTRPWREGRMGV